jgi:hypothetical protein
MKHSNPNKQRSSAQRITALAPGDAGAIVQSCREAIAATEETIARIESDCIGEKPRRSNGIAIVSAPLQEASTFPAFPRLKRRNNKDGSVRFYFKHPDGSLTRLPDDLASDEFIAAYAAASAAPDESKSIPAARLGFTLKGDDPLAAPLIMIWCALKSGDRDRAENIFVRLSADADENDVSDKHAIDAAMATAMAMVRARRTP